MKTNQTHPFIWFGIGIGFILIIHLIVSGFDKGDEKLANAEKSYEKGEIATQIKERTEAFNEALKLYKEIEKEYRPTFGNGKLYYNIGNSYFQLGQYPLSYLNYERAKNLAPRDEQLRNNIKITKEKLGLLNVEKSSIFQNIFYFHNHFSVPERLEFFLLFSFLAFLFASLLIWFKHASFKMLSLICLFCTVLMSLSLFYSQFISPSYGILLKANLLYQDGGIQYAKVLEKPLPAGTKVEVLQIVQAGKWIKIETPDGTMGYIPSDAMEII